MTKLLDDPDTAPEEDTDNDVLIINRHAMSRETFGCTDLDVFVSVIQSSEDDEELSFEIDVDNAEDTKLCGLSVEQAKALIAVLTAAVEDVVGDSSVSYRVVEPCEDSEDEFDEE